MDPLKDLTKRIRSFNSERQWEQFHSPKNLAMALSVEASEIVELFQWLTQQQSMELEPDKVQALREEIADVLIYLLNLADKLGIDPVEAAHAKIDSNASRYPTEVARGRSCKHTAYKK